MTDARTAVYEKAASSSTPQVDTGGIDGGVEVELGRCGGYVQLGYVSGSYWPGERKLGAIFGVGPVLTETGR